MEVVWGCLFAPWESHPERRSPDVGVLFVGDRSRSNTGVDGEGAGWNGMGTAKHCRDGVVVLDENLGVMIA
jgi:hypothetical protein